MSTHANAPLSIEGRRRLIERCQYRPIAHVAAEMGISRACASKWVNRWRRHGEIGLHDRASTPKRQPTAIPAAVVVRIEQLRRDKKWSARRIGVELAGEGIDLSIRTIGRHLVLLGLNRRRFIDPDGETNRVPGRINARYPGHMIHLDVKKVGRIPDGGGWRAHGRGSAQALAADRDKTRRGSPKRPGYSYLHSAIDGFSRLAYTEALPDETAHSAIGFWARARAWFAAHGIDRITRVVTDNGACYRAKDFVRTILAHATRHQRTRPYTPRHNGKIERYQRILAEDWLYARTWTSESQRTESIGTWNLHYNYHRPHTACGNQPPASRLRQRVTNLMTSNS